MNLLLDMKTIFITLVIGHLFTVVLISAYWRGHSKDRMIGLFFLAKCLQAIAWLLLVLSGGIPDVFTVSIANSLMFLGTASETVAFLKFLNAFGARAKKLCILLTAINLIVLYAIILLDNAESYRVAWASFGTAAAIVYPSWRMLREKGPSLLPRIIGGLYLLVAASLIGRGAAALMSERSMGLFTPGVIQSFTFLSLYLVMILGNTGFVLLLKERTDQELLRLASTDDLTGALNRRTFSERAQRCLSDYARREKPVSYLLFDIDLFKTINDTYGHLIGDRILQDLTAQIKSRLGPDDLFVRYGGDEFGILLPGRTEAESDELARRIRQQAEGGAQRGLPVSYTISMGILTVVPHPQLQMETLYTLCDSALYRAKNAGRNSVCRGSVSELGPPGAVSSG